MILGSHVKMSGSEMMLGSVKEAISYDANCFMIYTGAPQNSIRKSIDLLKIKEAHELMREHKMELKNIIVHAPYIVNPGNSDIDKQNFAIDFLTNEVIRTSALGSSVLVLHPGNYLKQDIETTIKNISFVLNKIIENTKDLDVVIALETMSGKGTEVGSTFEQLNEIIKLVTNKKRIGVCLDTCHIHDSGYDIVEDYENVVKSFDEIIGLKYLKVIHLNDSKNVLGARKDRHENIGLGNIGIKTLVKVCNDERFKDVPKILETPYVNDVPPYKEEIEKIKKYGE